MTRDGSNARKRAARELAAAEQITYTEALRRTGQRVSPAGQEGIAATRAARVTQPVATLTTDVVLIGHTGPVTFVAFCLDGHTVASGGDATARLWDLATRQATTVLTSETNVTSAALSPDGGTLAVVGADGTVTLWAFASGQVTALTGCDGQLEAVAFSPDGRTLASSEWQPPDLIHGSTEQGGAATVRLWNLATGQPAALPTRKRCYAGKALAFHPGGHILACNPGMDGTLQLLDLATGRAATLAGHTLGVETAAFSPDGRTLATGSCDATIRLWDLATAQTTAILTPRGGYVVFVTFSPDGRTLATASLDRTVRLWDLATGQPAATLSAIPSSSPRRRSAPTAAPWQPAAGTGQCGCGPPADHPADAPAPPPRHTTPAASRVRGAAGPGRPGTTAKQRPIAHRSRGPSHPAVMATSTRPRRTPHSARRSRRAPRNRQPPR